MQRETCESKIHPGDEVIIISCTLEAEMEEYRPLFSFMDEENRITRNHLRAQSH